MLSDIIFTAVEGDNIEFMTAIKAIDGVMIVVQQTAIMLSLVVQRGAVVINILRRYQILARSIAATIADGNCLQVFFGCGLRRFCLSEPVDICSQNKWACRFMGCFWF